MVEPARVPADCDEPASFPHPAEHGHGVAAGLDLAIRRDGVDARSDRTARCRARSAAVAPRRVWQSRAGCASRSTRNRAWADVVLDRWGLRALPGACLAKPARHMTSVRFRV